jgi:hypothetical protein
MTSPLTFNLPPMNSRWAFALPLTNLPKSSSESDRVTVWEEVSPCLHSTATSDMINVIHCPAEMINSVNEKAFLPVGLSPSPFPTSPLFFRSICQLSVSPALFFNVKANTAFPCLIASFRSASDDWRAALMASKASEEGKASSRRISLISSKRRAASSTVLERHGEWEAVKLLGVRKGSSS